MTVSSRLLRRTFPVSAVIVGASFWITAQTGTLQRKPRSGEWPVFGGSVDWPVYRGDPKGNQFSTLAQINATNVHQLRPAWEYHTRDASERSSMYANPIVINGIMYLSTPSLKAVALDAATGRQIWAFDPAKYNNGAVIRLRNRGVTYWK